MFLNFLTIIIIFFVNPTFALEFPNQDEVVKVEIIPSKVFLMKMECFISV